MIFRHGIVGVHPSGRQRKPRKPKFTPPSPEPVIEVEIIEVIETEPEDESVVEVITIEPEIVEEKPVEPPKKKKLKDMTAEGRKAFYKARAAKALAAKKRKKAIAAFERGE
jgi:hypothetical protein